MKREHQAFLGFAIFFGMLILYVIIVENHKNYGNWIWIPIGAILAGNIAAVIRFPMYRSWLGRTVLKGGFSALAEYFTRDDKGGFAEREAVPPALRRKIFLRAKDRCQFPSCDVRGRPKLDIHHINMNRSESFDMDNLIAVCPNHHREIHNNTQITNRQVRQWAQRHYQLVRGRR